MSTNIRLYLRTRQNPQYIFNGTHVRTIRLLAAVSFKEPDEWSRPNYAIVDTGSPTAILPKFIWKPIRIKEIISETTSLYGIGQGSMPARLARVEMAFLSTRKEIIELTVKAYFAENDSVPLLLGSKTRSPKLASFVIT
ncbi:MAG: hypothetical protein ACE5I1_10475 [bacterium]